MSRGIRNNNPLNIRRSADRWEGARDEQTDNSFVQFETMAYGYRAAWKTLESYWRYFRDQRKPFNVRNVIARWAPPAENDTDSYIRRVLVLTGLGGNENFPRPSRATGYERLELLVRGMTVVECGISYREVNVPAIRQGFDLAFPGKRKVKRGAAGSTEASLMWDEYRDW